MSQEQDYSQVPGFRNAFEDKLPRFTQDISTQLILPKTDEEVIDLIPQLLAYINDVFPRQHSASLGSSQSKLREGTNQANLSFSALESVLQRVNSPCTAIPKHQKNSLAQFVIGGLVGFDLILSTIRLDVGDEAVDTIQTLQQRAFNIVISMLQQFSQCRSESSRASWDGLQSLYKDMCHCVRGKQDY